MTTTYRMVVLLVITFVAVTLGCTTAEADRLVDDDQVQCPDAAYTSIQAAVNDAAPGETITVCAGVYSELVTVNKTLTLHGAQQGVHGSRGPGGPASESIVNGADIAGGHTTAFHVTASGVTIDGFTVQEATNASQLGAGIVLAAGTGGSHIANNVIHANTVGLFLASNGVETVLERNMFLANNQPGPASGTGIYTDQFVAGGGVANVRIDDNLFIGHADDGAAILLSSTTPASQSNITMSMNTFNANGRALVAFNLVGSTFIRNTIANSTFAASADIRLFEGIVDLAITCNTLAGSGNPMRAIRISNIGTGSADVMRVTINNNNISGYGGAGLEVDAGSYTGPPAQPALNAQQNWWGSPTGPVHPSNPGGTGLLILDPDGVVSFKPFRTAASACDARLACDIDGDGDIDRNDINIITLNRNRPAAFGGDPLDTDGDGMITVKDARVCTLGCTRPNCAP